LRRAWLSLNHSTRSISGKVSTRPDRGGTPSGMHARGQSSGGERGARPRPRPSQDLPCDGQRLTAKLTANGADRWVGSDEDERWPVGTGAADAAGRVPPW
jgi:hypothetical protein